MKIYAPVAVSAVLLLAACGSEKAEQSEQAEQEQAVSSEEVTEEKADETVEENPEEVTEDEEPAEETAAEPVEPLYEINEANWSVTPISDAPENVVLLTIDDAPDQHAVEMAQKLHAADAPAIFFVNGHFLDTPEEEEMLKEIHELGFPIGNHTYSHPNLRDISEDEQREEIISLSDRVEEIIGERPKFFRAPFGANTDFTEALAKEEGMVLMNWTYGYDWEADYQDAAALADIMVNTEYLSAGANLLMHDRAWTNDALTDIVEGLRAKDYTIVDPKTIKGYEVSSSE
ncbi:polysaccharide deacetylase family protein [Jeotgalibacillus haloalkalitolerans]|uniref:Polysaccharide deacetylase family protein n=1 Tax=Jeotgalibacillus haloalkalitolerans TaxID=3104292 RepID=A0ABU5KNR4_9BACL|nr:polysaccharide deacetylase family protein [Jeotgalibacillus sp. HH7-29]MDZ5712894.1 polysaccharide deacetylase family protein [Jeotgalibacillus sp. HH7-29]